MLSMYTHFLPTNTKEKFVCSFNMRNI